LKAVEYLSGLRRGELDPWRPSRNAVVMEGPGFYFKGPARGNLPGGDQWDVRSIKHGLVYEFVYGEHRRMDYYAIDLDRNRVYYHYESGGFPPKEYRPEGQPSGDRSKTRPR
jgi:hypothetical protein